MWCIQTLDSEYRKRMYDVLDLYKEDYDPKRPLICLDKKPKQLLEDKWCIQTLDSEYRKRMYDVLDLYEEDYDPKRPLICLDKKPKQLLEDKKRQFP